MNGPHEQAERELETKTFDEDLLERCLRHAQGNENLARSYYLHRRTSELEGASEDPDRRENWPMLAPLLILYTLGTIGVLALGFGFLANRLGWW